MGDPCLKWVYDRKVVEEDNQTLDGPGNPKGGSPQLDPHLCDRVLERPVMNGLRNHDVMVYEVCRCYEVREMITITNLVTKTTSLHRGMVCEPPALT